MFGYNIIPTAVVGYMSHSTMLIRKTAILPTYAGEDRRRSHKFFLKFFEKPVVLISPIHAPNAPAQARDAAHVNRGKRTPSKNFRKNLLLLRLPHLASVRRTAVFRAWYNESCSLGDRDDAFTVASTATLTSNNTSHISPASCTAWGQAIQFHVKFTGSSYRHS